MAEQEPLKGTLAGFLESHMADAAIDRRITGFALILAGLFLLDILSTHFILRLGGIELNPAMTGIVANPLVHLVIKAGTLLLIVLVSIIAEKEVRGSAIAFYCVIITLYIFVIINNTFVLIPKIAGF